MDPDRLIAVILLLVGLATAVFGAATVAALPVGARSRRFHSLPHGDRAAMEWASRERPALGFTAVAVSGAGMALTCGAVAHLMYGGTLPTWAGLSTAAVAGAVLVWLVEAVPSALVARVPERSLRMLIHPLRLLHVLLTPVLAVYRLAARSAAGAIPRGKRRGRDDEEEVESLVDELGADDGELEEEARDMIRGIIAMDTTTARMIMVPRMDVVAAEVSVEPDQVVEIIGRHGYSRIPLYEDSIDNIVGIVYAKDLLRALHSGAKPPSLRALARTPYFVPESKRIDDLLRELREQRTHVAIVVDEYGGTAGLVTLEDLLEEIVGEIEDEYERGERAHRPIEQISPTEAILDARVSIEDLNELFETEIEHEGYDTVGGLVYSQLGKIPSAGDQVQVNGLTIWVVSTLGHRIKQVRAVHTEAEGPG